MNEYEQALNTIIAQRDSKIATLEAENAQLRRERDAARDAVEMLRDKLTDIEIECLHTDRPHIAYMASRTRDAVDVNPTLPQEEA